MAKKLTEKQKRFCDYYIETGNAAEAARLAGYSKRTARQMGQENLTKPYILEYIQKRNEELRNERTADMQEVREFWTEMMRNKEETGMNRLKASEFLAKTEGAFIEKLDIEMNQKSESRVVIESLIKDEDIQQKIIEKFRASSK